MANKGTKSMSRYGGGYIAWRCKREQARKHQFIWMLSKEEEAAIMIFVPIRRIGVATCVTPTDRGGPLTRAMGPGSNKSASLFVHFIFPLRRAPPFFLFAVRDLTSPRDSSNVDRFRRSVHI